MLTYRRPVFCALFTRRPWHNNNLLSLSHYTTTRVQCQGLFCYSFSRASGQKKSSILPISHHANTGIASAIKLCRITIFVLLFGFDFPTLTHVERYFRLRKVLTATTTFKMYGLWFHRSVVSFPHSGHGRTVHKCKSRALARLCSHVDSIPACIFARLRYT